jgi:hypothetical protein
MAKKRSKRASKASAARRKRRGKAAAPTERAAQPRGMINAWEDDPAAGNQPSGGPVIQRPIPVLRDRNWRLRLIGKSSKCFRMTAWDLRSGKAQTERKISALLPENRSSQAETDPRNRGVGSGHCAPLKSAASRVFQCRQPLSGSVTDHQSRAGTSQDATKAAIRRIAMGSARSGA